MSLFYGVVCGGSVQEGIVLLAQLSVGFQSLSPLPTSKFGPSGADSWVGGFVYVLAPCRSLQWTLLWGWAFLLPPQPQQVFQSDVLRLYFPSLEPWDAQSVLFSSCLSQFICTGIWDHLLCQLLPHPVSLPCCKSSPSAAYLLTSYQSGWMFVL